MTLNTQCRCCGQPLPSDLPLRWDAELRTLVANGRSAAFTPQQARIVEALWRHRRQGPYGTLANLVDAAWSDDPNGGPECMRLVMMFIKQARERMEPIGWTITRNRGRPRVGYRLAPM